MQNDWEVLTYRDEYTEPTDTHTFSHGKYLYFWSDSTKLIRRYDKDGGYAEAKARFRPTSVGVPLYIMLHTVFGARKRQGTLLVNQTA